MPIDDPRAYYFYIEFEWMGGWVSLCVNARTDNLGCLSSPSTVFETGSVLFRDVYTRLPRS